MASLKDSVISGSLRATDTIYTNTLQTSIIRAPTTSGGAAYGPGSNGQVLKSNGSSVYWAADANTNTDTLVKQTASSGNAAYKILFTTSASPTSGNAAEAWYNANITINPSTSTITATNFAGKASTAGTADKATAANLTTTNGAIATYTDTAGKFGSTTIANIISGGVGSTAIGGANTPIYWNGSKFTASNTYPVTKVAGLTGDIAVASLRSALGLSQALRFIGKTTTAMSDGFVGTPAGVGYGTPAVGDVVIDNSSDSEYVCVSVSGTTYTWERLGPDGSWALANHTHPTSLTSGGTATINLSANTAYTLTAGGTSVIFKTPTDNQGVTSVTLTQGAGITVSSSGTAITTTGSRTISITGMDTTNGSTAAWLNQKGGWSTPTKASVGLGSVENVAGNARTFYGTCATEAATAAKVVTCTSYNALTTGDLLIVNFTNANSAGSPTLNVNDKGAKYVKKLYNGAINNLTNNAELRGTCMFLYDGTQWVLSNADYNSTYSSQTAASGGTTVSLVTTGEKYTWNNKSNLALGSTATTAMAGNTVVTNVNIAADTTINTDFPIVFGRTSTTTAVNEGLNKNSAKITANPSTGNIKATTFNGFTLAAASAKGVVTTVDTSASLPTANAVKTFVEGKGYTTNAGTVTSITLKAGAGITLDTDNTAITGSGTRTISISGINTSSGSEATCLTAKGTWKAFNNYSHPTGDGNLHVPATSTTNNGKFLKAGSTAGSLSWASITKSDVGLDNVANTNARVFYGTCATAAATAEKAVVCAAYDALTAGDLIIVNFTNANTAGSPTLNVNSKGAKYVKKLYNAAINNLNNNNEVRGTCIFLYDGTQWILSNSDYNNTYSSQTAASGGTAVSLVTTGEKYTWNNKSNLTLGTTATTALAGNTTVTNVAFTAATDNAEYPVLMKNSTGATVTAASAKFANTTNKGVTINPSTGTITAPAFNGVATKATAANLTTTANAIAYYTGTTGTFGTKATASGALYATATNGALNFGALPIAQGGTGKTSAAAAWTALGGGASGKHADSYFALASHTHTSTQVGIGSTTATIPSDSSSWTLTTSQDANGFDLSLATATITLSVTPANDCIVDINASASTTFTDYQEILDSWTAIYNISLSGNKLTVKATRIPTISIPIKIVYY